MGSMSKGRLLERGGVPRCIQRLVAARHGQPLDQSALRKAGVGDACWMSDAFHRLIWLG